MKNNNHSSDNSLSGFFLQNSIDANQVKKEILEWVKKDPALFKYDQYSSYYYSSSHSPHLFFIHRIEKLILAETGDWFFFYEITDYGPYLVGARLSKWDIEHFGINMAVLQIFLCPESPFEKKILKSILSKAIDHLKGQNIKFISARVNGDHINALHSMEDIGFRYYDDVIWPIGSTKHMNTNSKVRLMNLYEVNEVKYIAENFQYKRGHYYCDKRFDEKAVGSMYAKWIGTAANNNDPIAVIERQEKIAGLFVFKIDEELYHYTGYKYGRLRMLALNPKFRGNGVGTELFEGTLSLIKSMGCNYIDSGYSTKNHISARLHAKSGLFSAYEEVTFHLWID
jgi:GNAT superfamily N-acetyltransferase